MVSNQQAIANELQHSLHRFNGQLLQPQRDSSMSRNKEFFKEQHSLYKTDSLADAADVADSRTLHRDVEECCINMGVVTDVLQGRDFDEVVQFADNLINSYHSVIPKAFLTKYKNPCWYSNISQDAMSALSQLDNIKSANGFLLNQLTHRVFKGSHSKNNLLCLPYFFVAGYPKCATTTLDVGLRRHSQIVGPAEKEPHWWTRGPHVKGSVENLGALSVARYSLFFKPLADELELSSHRDLITYDASQSTLWDSPVTNSGLDYCLLPAVMSRLLPSARFVVMMRNPVNRLISHYIWSCSYHNGKDVSKWPTEVLQKGPQLFHEQVEQLMVWFDKCTQSESIYECVTARRFSIASNLTNTCGKIGHRLTIGMYHIHIRKWLQFFPRDQFLFLRMEDFISDPFMTMQRLTVFLDISPISRDEAREWFSEKVNQRTKEQDSLFRIQPSTKQLLKEFYSPHNELLADLLGDSRFLWG